jgi:hypothetical protein
MTRPTMLTFTVLSCALTVSLLVNAYLWWTRSSPADYDTAQGMADREVADKLTPFYISQASCFSAALHEKDLNKTRTMMLMMYADDVEGATVTMQMQQNQWRSILSHWDWSLHTSLLSLDELARVSIRDKHIVEKYRAMLAAAGFH